ncbi:MAG: protein kinase, partial [Deltaproteobacteria bacterium]|nr:protein kinase [Deltaproteobacteria bacterium]
MEEIKEGGMGLVYICQQDNFLRERTAFKTFKKEYFNENEQFLNSFLKECNTWISLGTHPFICTADRIESINGQPFVEMQSYKSTLTHEIFHNDLHKRISAVMRLALEICLAMVHADHKIDGFVHRDLKPTNILLGLPVSSPLVYPVRQDEEELFKKGFSPPWGHAIVTDFGLSKAICENQIDIPYKYVSANGLTTFLFSKSGKISGTPPYMSPEQCVGNNLDKSSDIYSLEDNNSYKS